MSKLIGYARVSTNEQDIRLQLDALKKAGCREKFIFTDKASGARADRPGLEACLKTLIPGDTLLVWRLDRLGRSMPHLVTLVEDLLKKKIAFKSICDGAIDTTTASGELIFNIFSSLAQFEKKLIQERTRAGLKAARARGRKGGRLPIVSTDPKVQTAKRMHKDHGMSINKICKILKISRATFYRYVALPEK
jgi:DNA invertase Pin-like site-specific DNA recombinase